MDACRQTSCLAREGAELSGQGRREADGESREVSQGMSLRESRGRREERRDGREMSGRARGGHGRPIETMRS